MGEVNWLAVVARWAHVGSAIVLVGGAVFMRYILTPAAETLAETDRDILRRGVRDRWSKFVHGGILLFLLSGIYNYWLQIGNHKGDGLYHALIGTKILVALAVFGLAEMMVGRSARAQRIRQDARRWLTLVVVLTALIVAISGFLRVRGPYSEPDEPVAPAAAGDTGE